MLKNINTGYVFGGVLRNLRRFLSFGLLATGVLVSLYIYSYTRLQTPAPALAATSSTLNFQARLLNSSGNLVADGDYNIEFKLYDVATDANTPKDQGACTYKTGNPDPNC